MTIFDWSIKKMPLANKAYKILIVAKLQGSDFGWPLILQSLYTKTILDQFHKFLSGPLQRALRPTATATMNQMLEKHQSTAAQHL